MSLRCSARVRSLSAAQDVVKTVSSGGRRDEHDSIPKAAQKASKGSKQSASSDARDVIENEPPSTPPRKKQRTTPLKRQASTSTATPAAVRLMTVPYSSGDIDDVTPPAPVDRPAEPHRTNAPLHSPETSRIVAYSDQVIDSSPSKSGLPRPTTTTGNLLDEARTHLLRVDPSLKTVIDKHTCRLFSPEGLAEEIDPFRSLTSGIIAQQVGDREPENAGEVLMVSCCPPRSLVRPRLPSRTSSLRCSTPPLRMTSKSSLTPSLHRHRLLPVTLRVSVPQVSRAAKPNTSRVSPRNSRRASSARRCW